MTDADYRGRIRRWRMKRAVKVLKPWWVPRIEAAHDRLTDPHEPDSRDGGYRQGVYSTLRNLFLLGEKTP